MDDQVRIRSIVWTKNEQNADEVRKLAAEVLEMIRNGASFEEMVSIYSEDQSMKLAKEAHLDWRSYIHANKAGRCRFLNEAGRRQRSHRNRQCHLIIKLEDIKAAHTLGIEEVRSSIESILKEQLQTNLKKNWVDRLKKKYLVRYY